MERLPAIDMTAQRNTESLTQTVSRYGKQLLQFIRQRVPRIEDAEDIVQDVWYQLSRLGNIDDLDSVSGWLYRVARNRITDLYRKKSTEPLTEFSEAEEDDASFWKEILLIDDSEHPEMKFFKDRFWQEMLDALAELPDNQRLVFVQHEIEEKTLQQIADEQSVNIKTIISRKGYAVKHLRNRLMPLYNELNY
jgi:RNA polymerase sigma factor (sigma-70 family)